MYNLDDKNLDRLSREAAENFRQPGEPSWENIEKTLDKEMPQEKKKRRGFLLWFILLGLLAGGSIYYFTKQNNTTHKTAIVSTPDKNNESVKTNPADNKTAEPVKTSPVNAISNNKDQSTSSKNADNTTGKSVLPPTTKNTVAANPNHSSNTAATTRKKQKDIASSNTPVSTNKTVPNSNTNSKTRVASKDHQPVKMKPGTSNQVTNNAVIADNNKNRKQPSYKVPPVQSSVAAGNKSKKNKNKQQDAVVTDTAPVEIKDATNSEIGKTNDDKKVDTAANANVTPPVISKADDAASLNKIVDSSAKAIATPANKKKNSAPADKGFSVAFVAGADMSTVKFKYGNNTGINIGILGGYHFNKNWSVHTGIIYTQKNYKLNGADYHPPDHYWTQYVPLETVDGNCHMWEVPVLGRYTFSSKSNHTFFVSGGLSSYFMTREHYNYNYKLAGASVTRSWTNDSSIHHILSILDLSVGFQRNIGKKLSWQLEPYARIPLSGVGFGKIELSSFGVNFSIQLKQPIKH